MNIAMIARCERTGKLGICLASTALAAGAHLYGSIRPNVGGILIDAKAAKRINRLATNLLAQGHNADYVLEAVKSNADNTPAYIVVIDRESSVAIHVEQEFLSTHLISDGDGYAIIYERGGNAKDLATMVNAFDSTPDLEFDERLLRVLEEGVAEPLTTESSPSLSSAALLVYGTRDYSETDLRVDLHDEPVKELRRIYSDFKPTAAYYEERAKNPSKAVNAVEFAGVLLAQRETNK